MYYIIMQMFAVGTGTTFAYGTYKVFSYFRSYKESFREWLEREDVEATIRTVGEFLKRNPNKFIEMRCKHHEVHRAFLEIKKLERWTNERLWHSSWWCDLARKKNAFKKLYRTLQTRVALAYQLRDMK